MITKTYRLDKLGQWASIVMSLCVAAAAVQFMVGGRWSPQPVNISAESGVPVGKQVQLPEEARSGRTAILLLAVNSRCKFCTESMPFYKRLTELSAVQDGKVTLALLSSQTSEEIGAYAARHGVDIRTIVPLGGTGLPITATPTLVLVDKSGKVTQSWVGYLNKEQQLQVEKAMVDVVTQ